MRSHSNDPAALTDISKGQEQSQGKSQAAAREGILVSASLRRGTAGRVRCSYQPRRLRDNAAQHRAKLHSTNPIERLNVEIRRRTDVVSIFPNEAAITRLMGAILMEQTEEWAVQRSRYMTLETLAPIGDDHPVSLPAAQSD